MRARPSDHAPAIQPGGVLLGARHTVSGIPKYWMDGRVFLAAHFRAMLHGIVRLDDGFGDYRLQATCDKCSHVRMIEPATVAKILG